MRIRRTSDRPPLLALIDSGDIVDNGVWTDQFVQLEEILRPLARWPYLVAIGNHELDQNRDPVARQNMARFMGDSADGFFGPNRLFYRKDAPGLRLIFLNTNDWVYGPDDRMGERGRSQLAWLASQMSERFDGRTIVLMHHPIIVSSKKHRGHASALWQIGHGDENLATMFARGGVDLVLTGHTHTYERYHLALPGTGDFDLVNVSGRPRNTFLWIGASRRRAQDIRGREVEYLRRVGWRAEDLPNWQIQQRDGLFDEDDDANQWVELRFDGQGPIELEVFVLDPEAPAGYASHSRFTID